MYVIYEFVRVTTIILWSAAAWRRFSLVQYHLWRTKSGAKLPHSKIGASALARWFFACSSAGLRDSLRKTTIVSAKEEQL